MSQTVVDYHQWVLKDQWIEMMSEGWNSLNYHHRLSMMPSLRNITHEEFMSTPWLKWDKLAPSVREKLLDLYANSAYANQVIQHSQAPLYIYLQFDTGKEIIESPESPNGEEEYGDERWLELAAKYLE